MSRPFRPPSGPRGYNTGPRGPRNFSGSSSQGAAEASDDPLLDEATAAVELFVEDYYKAANYHRQYIATYYLPTPAVVENDKPTCIVFNGIEMADGRGPQEFFEKNYPRSRIEVDTLDCHILNTNLPPSTTTPNSSRSIPKRMSILVVVGGIFKASDERDAEEDDFNDSLILVTNPEPPPPRGTRNRSYKDYLIETQTFRLVSGDPEEAAPTTATFSMIT